MENQISVTRALTEIKHMSDRIFRASNAQFVGVAKGRETKQVCITSPQSSIVDVTSILKGNLQSIFDLIDRRERLKRAVIISNAETIVKIGNATMTVAEAIEKKTSLTFMSSLLDSLRRQFTESKVKIDAANTKLMSEIDMAVQQAYGNEKGKVEAEQYHAVAAPRLNISEYSMIDPNKIEEQIKKLEDAIDEFKTEVDFVLSESNARTSIAV